MRMPIYALSAFALAAPAWAADVSGKWEAVVNSPRGEMTLTFDLKAEGEKLTGTVANEMTGESEIQDGKVDGDNVSFKQVMQFGDRSMTLLYEGKISGDELELTRKREGGPGAGGRGPRGGGPGVGGGVGDGPRGGRGGGRGGEQTFTAKRVE